jgi:hypothetical protein
MKWSIEQLEQEALKYKTKKEFKEKNSRAFHAAAKRKLVDKICAHMPKRMDTSGTNSSSCKWTFEKLQEEASKHKSRSDFEKENLSAYNSALKRGFLDQICSHMGPRKNEPWTDEELFNVALKYKTRSDFFNNDNGAYQAAKIRGLFEKISAHMPKVDRSGENGSSFKWTFEKLQEEALKYKTRGEFQKYSSAYSTACGKKLLDSVCAHMGKSGNVSLPEENLFDIIKNSYPKTQKLRIRKKNLIVNKPHIQGFDLDIYIPELRKAIEFDGGYWHSIDGLKRSREHWPEEDIKNYSVLKDSYFLDKHSILVLHIKEEDWNKNRESCINKCLEFLKQENKVN